MRKDLHTRSCKDPNPDFVSAGGTSYKHRCRSPWMLVHFLAMLGCMALLAGGTAPGNIGGTMTLYPMQATLGRNLLSGFHHRTRAPLALPMALGMLECLRLRGGGGDPMQDIGGDDVDNEDDEIESQGRNKAHAPVSSEEARRKRRRSGTLESTSTAAEVGAPSSESGGSQEIEQHHLDAIEPELQQESMVMVPRLAAASTFSGLFAQSPAVHLPGYANLTLEHFRAERSAYDSQGQFLPADTYMWRGRLVRILFDQDGRKLAILDVATGAVIHEYAQRQEVFLRGHTGVYLEDFPMERIPTDELGVYQWRDRTVRVIVADNKMERIIDAEDGAVVYMYTEEDLQNDFLNADLFSLEYHKLDRPASEARLARITERASQGGPPFGRVHVVWPVKDANKKDDTLRHGGTVVWLHGIGGAAGLQQMADDITARFRMPWVKYMFPSAPLQPVGVLGGQVSSSWFDVTQLSEGGVEEDAQGLARSADYVAQLVQDEISRGVHPSNVLVCGFGQGAAVAVAVALRGYTWERGREKEEEGQLPDSDDADYPQTITAMADWHEMLEARQAEREALLLEAREAGGASYALAARGAEVARVGGVALMSGWFPDSLVDLKPPWAKHLLPTYWMGKKCGKRGGGSACYPCAHALACRLSLSPLLAHVFEPCVSPKYARGLAVWVRGGLASSPCSASLRLRSQVPPQGGAVLTEHMCFQRMEYLARV